MKTIIRRDGHVIDVVQRELTDADLVAIFGELWSDGICVEPSADMFGTVHLWALVDLTTEQEVRALRAFADRTDALLAWHKAEAVA